MSRKITKTFVVALFVLSSAGRVTQAQTNASAQRIQAANAASERRCDEIVARWKRDVERLGSSAGFKRWVATASSWSTGSNGRADARTAFRSCIVDDVRLARQLEEACRAFQAELIRESTVLAEKMGVEHRTSVSAWSWCAPDSGSWDLVFVPVCNKAHGLRPGLIRKGAVRAGSWATTYAIVNGLHHAGMCGAACGSIELAVCGVVFGFVVDALFEEAADPSERHAKELRQDFLKARDELLSGRRGFVRAMECICRHHQQQRLTLLAP